MPKSRAGNITMNYDQQGSGEPLVLIPYLAADYACYAFQVADYSKHFTCISVDLRGTGESDKPAGVYSTEMFADDVAALMQAIGIHQGAHLRALAGGGHRHVAGREISRPGQVTFAAQRLAQERCLSQDRRARLAGDGQGDEQRAGDGDPRDLPVVLHARAVCAETGVHPEPCPTSCAAGPSSRSTRSSRSPMR